MQHLYLFSRVPGRVAANIFRWLALVVALVAANASSAATPASCYTCAPQCVPAARSLSGVDFPRVAYARDIPDAARKAKFAVTSTPPLGRKSVAVIGLGSVDHAVAVINAVQVNGETHLVVAHSNYDCKCSSEAARATFANGKLTFITGALKGRSIAVRAFVANRT